VPPGRPGPGGGGGHATAPPPADVRRRGRQRQARADDIALVRGQHERLLQVQVNHGARAAAPACRSDRTGG
jgi:hypothetical protein